MPFGKASFRTADSERSDISAIWPLSKSMMHAQYIRIGGVPFPRPPWSSTCHPKCR
ncbi:unnamed protein product [Fusarium graminearum]|uniref:Chromosome 4, complete genome n=1 Tax=Gibberella zeae (strain ATCC MYA-4620 / CBS 123657 / FGSC 9075 / NRRL 31084 / PH-1) TaxID=229533 RepID=A0A098DUE8_GIBZE|nr:unnamed protein product [Fusarium graminearum]CZS73404.1 unnamed protein product [Fusarium graminearum]